MIFPRSGLHTALVWLVTLNVVGVVVLFDGGAAQAFDLPKSLFSHGLAWVLAALVSLALYRHGWTVVPPTRIHWIVALFLAVNVAATLFAADRYVALFGERARYLGLTFVLDMVVLYAATAIAFRSERDWSILLSGLGAVTLIVLGYAIMQRAGLDPVRWSADPRDRPFSTLGNPDMFGQFLTIAMCLAAGSALFRTPPANSRLIRAIAIALAIATVVVAGFVATRGTLVGMAAGAFVLAAAYIRLRGLGALSFARVTAAAVVLTVVVVGLLFFTPLGERARATITEGAATADRLLIYDSAWHAFLTRPVLGYGPDGFQVAYSSFRQPGSAAVFGSVLPQSSAHNWVLQTAATIGAVGMLSLIALIGATLVTLWRMVPRGPLFVGPLVAATVAYWVQGLTTVGSISVDWLPWIACAAAASLTPLEPAGRIHRTAVWVPWAFVALAAIVGSSGINALRASEAALTTDVATRARRADIALAAARQSVDLDGGRAEHWNNLGLAHDLRQSWALSAGAYADAASRAWYDPTYWSNLARSRARQALAGDNSGGGAEAALAAARRGVSADPNDPRPHAALAEIANAFGRYDEALVEITTAITLYPVDTTYDQTAVTGALGIIDVEKGRKALQAILKAKDSAALRKALAQLDLRVGDRVSALANARRAVELDPNDAEARRLLETLQK